MLIVKKNTVVVFVIILSFIFIPGCMQDRNIRDKSSDKNKMTVNSNSTAKEQKTSQVPLLHRARTGRYYSFEQPLDGSLLFPYSIGELISEKPFNGKSALRLFIKEQTSWDKNLWRGGIRLAKLKKVTPGDNERIQFYIRNNGASELRFSVSFHKEGDINNNITKKSKKVVITTIKDWKKLSFDITIPENADEMKVIVWLYAKNSDAYVDFDDLVIDNIDNIKNSIQLNMAKVNKIENRLNIFTSIQKNEITLDGKFTEDAWEKLPWHGNFTHYKTKKPAKHKTQFKLLKTKQGLYVAIQAFGGEAVTGKYPDNSREIYNTDVVEVFITPDYCKNEIYQFVVNGSGSIFINGKNVPNLYKIKRKIKAVSQKNNNGYTVEMFIPVSVIPFINKNEVIGFNLGRESKINGQKSEVSSWSGCQDSFFNYFSYGRMLSGAGKDKTIAIENFKIGKNTIKFSYKGRDNGQMVARLFYFHQHSATFGEYLNEDFSLKTNSGEKSIPFPAGMNGGWQYLLLVQKDSTGIIASSGVKFFIDEPPKYINLDYKNPVIFPRPKEETWSSELFDLTAVKNILYYPSENGYEEKTAQKIKKYFKKYNVLIESIKMGDADNSFPANTIILGSLKNEKFKKAMGKNSPSEFKKLNNIPVTKEGYILKLGKKGSAILAGQDGAGAYYAFRSFLQILSYDSFNVFQTEIIDWPDHPRRGVKTNFMLPTDMKSRKRAIFEIYAGYKYNYIIIQTTLGVRWKSIPELATRPEHYSFTPEDVKALITYCKENFLTPFPEMNTPAHNEYWLLRAFPEMKEYPKTKNKHHKQIVCTRHPEYYNKLFPVMKEVFELFGKPETFHIGHDEIRNHIEDSDDPWACPRCGRTPKWQLYLDDILKQAEYLKSLGVKNVGVWDDMLHPKRNGGEKYGNTGKILDKLPKDSITIFYWLGGGAGDPTVDGEYQLYFKKKFNNIAWGHNALDVGPYLKGDLKRFWGLFGLRWTTIFPWVTWDFMDVRLSNYQFLRLIYDANIFWNNNTKERSYTAFEYEHGGEIMRLTASRRIPPNSSFQKIPLPGRKNLDDVWKLPNSGFNFSVIEKTLEKSRFKNLMNDGDAILLNNKHTETEININKKHVGAISILHTAHFIPSLYKSYQKRLSRDYWTGNSDFHSDGRQIGKYIIQYADGSKKEYVIRIGYNIFACKTDDRTRIIYDAAEAWNIPLNGQGITAYVFVIDDLDTRKKIKSITFQKTENAVEMAVFSMNLRVKK
jgi:cellulose/xylan binding protein with CBM9 domain/glycosyl hydrolase family 20